VSFICGYPQITSSIDQLDRFLKEFYWSRLDEEPPGTREIYRVALRDINDDSSFTQPPLNFFDL